MRGRNISYTELEMVFLEVRADWPRRELHERFCSTFGRDDVSFSNLKALMKRKGWMTGRTGCFEPGIVPANKGKKMPYHPNSAATRFKKGERRGVAVGLWKPIGTERVSRDGYIERKVNDDLPLQARWRAVQLIRWEEVHGPVPKGYCLKCLDGDKANTDPSNWEAIPRAMLPRLAGIRSTPYDAASPEVKPAIMAVAKLEHMARSARKDGAA